MEIEEVREIDEIQFGIYSADEIKRMAVCKVDNPKLCNNDKNGSIGTVYDPRMGTIENGKICATCSSNVWQCSGHFGYISLNEPVIHPLYFKQVVSFLRCFCTKCYKLLITEDQILVNGYNRSKGVKRFNKILERLEKIDMCTHCSHPQPAIKHTIADNTISMVYKNKDKHKVSITLQVDEIKKIFDNINIKDVELLGFNPDLMQPKNLILTVFPVIPTSARPYVISDTNMCDDDLTIQLVEIIKANNNLEQTDGMPISDTKKQKYLQSLKFRIATFYNNSCLAPDTPVLLWNGSIKRADEIKWLDELIGDDGQKRTVLSTCSGEDEMFEIKQRFGDKYIVNSNHYLTLIHRHHKKIYWCDKSTFHPMGSWVIYWFDGITHHSKYVEPTDEISEDDALLEIQTFADSIDDNNIFDIKVKDYMKLSDNAKYSLLGIKLYKSVNWDTIDVDIDPYQLGTWFGKINREFHKKEDVYLDGFEYTFGKKLHKIYEKKRIPDEYMYNDKETRIMFLSAFLISSDSLKDKKKDYYEIYQNDTYKQLIFQIKFLASSLGFANSLKKEKDSQRYILTIMREKKSSNDKFYTQIKVSPIGVGKYNGFVIDKNHRFLLSDFTITHNSGKAKHSTNGRSIKGIKERLTGKDGLIRTNLMGK